MSNNIVNIPAPAEPITETGAPMSKKWWKFLEQFKSRNEEEAAEFTPTISATSGTFTDVSGNIRYVKRGRLVWFHLFIEITTNGTAGTAVVSNLPFTPDVSTVSFGVKVGAVLIGTVLTNNTVSVLTTAGGYPGGNGVNLTVTGTYRTAA